MNKIWATIAEFQLSKHLGVLERRLRSALSCMPPACLMVPAWDHTHVGCWNALVSARNGIERVGWCRKPECGAPDKMHHDSSLKTHAIIQSRGWPWQLDAIR